MKWLVVGCLLVVGASAACKTDNDCDIGQECKKGVCANSDFISIPGKCDDPNEEWRECSEDCVPTCTHPDPVCIKDCRKHSCQCKRRYVRDKTKCIPLEQCKKRGGPSPLAETAKKGEHQPCRQTSECQAPLVCSQKQCTSLEPDQTSCKFNSDCPSGFACGKGFCAPLPRKTIGGIVEHLGSAGDDCIVPNDCKPGFVCREFKCLADGAHKGIVGDQCASDSECATFLACVGGLCLRHGQSQFSTEKPTTAAPVGGTSHSLSQLLAGERLTRQDGSAVSPADLDRSIVALYMCAEWSFPCRDFIPTLKSFYDAVRARGEAFEVIYVPKDNKPEEYNKIKAQFGNWIALPFGFPRADEFLRTFEAHGIPSVPLIKNGRLVADDIRASVHYAQRGDPMELFNKWKSS